MSLKACSRLMMARKFLWGVPEKIQEEDRWVKLAQFGAGMCILFATQRGSLAVRCANGPRTAEIPAR